MSDPKSINVNSDVDYDDVWYGNDSIEDELDHEYEYLEDDEPKTGKKRGRKMSEFWTLFTDDSNPQKMKSAVCKHCKTLINHHKKSESAKVHLNCKCSVFRRVMNGIDICDRPSWYTSNKRPAVRTQKVELVEAATSSLALSKGQSSIKNHMLPAMTRKQREQFQYHMAMHYYTTGTSFQRIEDEHLAKAISILLMPIYCPIARSWQLHYWTSVTMMLRRGSKLK